MGTVRDRVRVGDVVLNHQKFLDMDPVFRLSRPFPRSMRAGRLVSHAHGDRAAPLGAMLAGYVPSSMVLQPGVEMRMARPGRQQRSSVVDLAVPLSRPSPGFSARVSPTLSRVILHLTFSSPRSAPCS
uniref:Uncharacterized protein n=1 Tax=Rousettus aegyptiacus TaxID=9407 RepID=A0A7J8HRQ1_ROUAE|nr:hypothetical protein HJG63_011127 [Rousettus aegyptiacus]